MSRARPAAPAAGHCRRGPMLDLVATSVGLLPERIDLSHVFASYGVGTVFGEVVAARRRLLDSATSMRRYGVAVLLFAVAGWTLVLIDGLR